MRGVQMYMTMGFKAKDLDDVKDIFSGTPRRRRRRRRALPAAHSTRRTSRWHVAKTALPRRADGARCAGTSLSFLAATYAISILHMIFDFLGALPPPRMTHNQLHVAAPTDSIRR